VSDMNDTPNLAASYCPGCEPTRDPLQEILSVHWCDEHRPEFDGHDDDRAIFGTSLLSTVGEAEAETNRPWCELVHRARRPRRPPRSSRSSPGHG